MAYYLLELAYTHESWTTLISHPQNRPEAVHDALEKLGGRIDSAWLALGDYDMVAVIEMPDNLLMAALSYAVSASGVARRLRVTPLLTWEEGMEAMRQGRLSGYRPPSG